MKPRLRPRSSLRRLATGAAAAVLAIGALVACGGGSSASGSSSVFKLGTTEQATSMNPLKPAGGTDLLIWRNVFPQLVTYDSKLAPAPSFASSWVTSNGGKTITFQLHSGGKWSDGQPITAEDAAFTINMLVKYQSGPTGAAAAAVQGVTKATAEGATTLVVDYSGPTADALGNMAYQFFILPEHIWSSLATGDGSKLLTFANYPNTVTGGAFKLTSWSSQFVLTARNTTFWGTAPKLTGFGVQYFANDESEISALQTKAIDGVRIPTPTVIQAASKAGYVVKTTQSLGYQTLELNSNADKTNHKELLDPAVRLALDTAIDRDRIVKEANLGYGSAGVGIVTPASPYFDKSLTAPTFDLAKANAILDQAGYTKGSDGIRRANGQKMSYSFNFPSTMRGAGDRTFAILQEDWAKIGIQITPKYIDAAANFADIQGPNDTFQSFDIGFWDWVAIPPEPGFILGVQTCAARSGYSDTGYCNATYDAQYAAQAEQIDPAQRQQTLDSMQSTLQSERGVIVFYTVPAVDIHAQGWTGTALTGLQTFELPNTWDNLQKTS